MCVCVCVCVDVDVDVCQCFNVCLCVLRYQVQCVYTLSKRVVFPKLSIWPCKHVLSNCN